MAKLLADLQARAPSFELCNAQNAMHDTLFLLNNLLALPIAGATADAFTLFERLEAQLEANSGESC